VHVEINEGEGLLVDEGVDEDHTAMAGGDLSVKIRQVLLVSSVQSIAMRENGLLTSDSVLVPEQPGY